MSKNTYKDFGKKFNYKRKHKELFNKYKAPKYKRLRKQQEVSLVCFDGFDIADYNRIRVPNFNFKEAIGYYLIHNFLYRRNQLVTEYIENKDKPSTGKQFKKTIHLKEPISLNSTFMKSKVSNYNMYMNHLRFNIESKENYVFNYEGYIKGVNSYQYSYPEKFPKLKFVKVRSNQVAKILYENTYEYQLMRNKDFKIICFNLNEVSHLLPDYNEITIDLNAVEKYLNDKLDEFLEKKRLNPNYRPKGDEYDYNKYLDDYLMACEIENGYYNFKRTINNSDGRLHSEFQRASKRIRQFCKINNKPIYEADITAAVPTIFCHQLKEIATEINLKTTKDGGESDWVSAPEKQETKLNLLPNHSMLPDLPPDEEPQLITNNNLVSKVLEKISEKVNRSWYEKLLTEIENFEEQLFQGTLYENFKEAYYKEYCNKKAKFDIYKNNKSPKRKKILFYDLLIEGDEIKIRKYLKGQFLAMLNAPADCKVYKAMKNAFRNIYPCISWILETIKTLNPKYQHKVFSHLVLQIEGEIILCTVTKEFKDMYPQCKLVTIHDCICTTSEYVIKLKHFMQERISEILNVNINVSSGRVTSKIIN